MSKASKMKSPPNPTKLVLRTRKDLPSPFSPSLFLKLEEGLIQTATSHRPSSWPRWSHGGASFVFLVGGENLMRVSQREGINFERTVTKQEPPIWFKIISPNTENHPKSFPKYSKSFPNHLNIIPKHTRIVPQTSQNHLNKISKQSPTHPNIITRASQHHPQSIQKSSPNHDVMTSCDLLMTPIQLSHDLGMTPTWCCMIR